MHTLEHLLQSLNALRALHTPPPQWCLAFKWRPPQERFSWASKDRGGGSLSRIGLREPRKLSHHHTGTGPRAEEQLHGPHVCPPTAQLLPASLLPSAPNPHR
ncbi:unnamed protein product [Rangifer tarandus platyrhynchus]|uniref:Uncharacterized protein n=1 Tax=Rangifer tarandus platyrhynchus TaxID=3082113 RepID=A0AC59Y225_RANTA